MLNDVLSVKERYDEYNDLEKCIRFISKQIEDCPEICETGVSIDDKELDYCIKFYHDEKGIYGELITEGTRTGLSDIDSIIKEAQRHFLEDRNGYDILANTVLRDGKEKTFRYGSGYFVITPISSEEAEIEFFEEDS